MANLPSALGSRPRVYFTRATDLLVSRRLPKKVNVCIYVYTTMQCLVQVMTLSKFATQSVSARKLLACRQNRQLDRHIMED